jgi:hypothetical protein
MVRDLRPGERCTILLTPKDDGVEVAGEPPIIPVLDGCGGPGPKAGGDQRNPNPAVHGFLRKRRKSSPANAFRSAFLSAQTVPQGSICQIGIQNIIRL